MPSNNASRKRIFLGLHAQLTNVDDANTNVNCVIVTDHSFVHGRHVIRSKIS